MKNISPPQPIGWMARDSERLLKKKLTMLLILEDDNERIERFQAVLQALKPNLSLQIWRDAHAMIREAGPLLNSASLLSLDHDLATLSDGSDPGDGYEVVQWLVTQPIIRPVIIHTSNSTRASWMEGAFELAGWQYERVPPLGDDWIEFSWRRVVRRVLQRSRNHPR